ncbi:MAG: DUF3332 family protein [Candidatus Sumerlaeota bacterium]|nr:DUF3332 family protein [Candidatus Sumerlaeota bacterium]
MKQMQKLRPRMTSLIAMTLLIVFLGATMACYGRFPMTRAVYRFNGEVGDDFHNRKNGDITKQAVFWAFVIIPVYCVAAIGDAIVLNLIEFWSESSLQVASQECLGDGTVVTLSPLPDGHEAELAVSKDGRVLAAYRLIRVSKGVCELRDAEGRLLGTTIRSADGDLVLADAQGKTVSTLKAADLAMLPARP